MVALFKDDVFSVRIIGCIPFVLALVFHTSLSIIRIRDGRVEYRQFLRWKPLPSTDVASSGVIWSPFIGFLCLRKSVPPWGRLFFILDPGSTRRSSRGDGLGILGYLHQKQEAAGDPVGTTDDGNDFRYGRLILAGICGVLASFLRVYLSPTVAPGTDAHNMYSSRLIESAMRSLAYIGNPQLAIPLLVGFVLLTVFLRKRPSAWSFAFLAGVVTPFALFSGMMR
ncbi:MAG: hypothetical protein ACRD22_01255 [Terriglobia bacterium]